MTDASSYDLVPYEDRPVAESHPDRLFLAARRAGVAAVHPCNARVLELGCAHAVNLMPIAAQLPDSYALGIDLSPSQIAVAAERIRASGLRNIEVRCADVMDLDLGHERFDYVIAHGLLSWVPEAVRARILALCREALVDDGVAYLSYNSMPAWGIRGGLRRALLEVVGDARDPGEQIRRAREGLTWLGELQADELSADGALLRAEIDGLRDRPDAYLLHEYLTPHSHAYWFREFDEAARAAGLRWVADVAPADAPSGQMRALRERLRGRVGDPVGVEQIVDVLNYRQFRASLVCRAQTPTRAFDPSEFVRELHIAAPPSESALDPMLAPVRARWPADLPVTDLAVAGLDGGNDTHFAVRLLDAHDDGSVQLRPRALPTPARIPERPRVSDLARFEARHFPFVTTLLHECAPLDPFHAALVRRLDGAHSRSELATALLEDIHAGRLRADRAVSDDALRHALPTLVDQALTRIFDAVLLVEEAS